MQIIIIRVLHETSEHQVSLPTMQAAVIQVIVLQKTAQINKGRNLATSIYFPVYSIYIYMYVCCINEYMS